MNEVRTPRIRFKGFTDDWEQCKFDEVFECTIPNNTLSRAELNYDSGSVRNVHYGDILIKYGSVVDVQNDEIPFVTGKSSDDFKGALLQDGDIIIADTAEDETTGKACEIGNSQGVDVVSGLHTMVCRPRNKMALGYLGYYLNSDAYHHQLLPLMQGIKVLSLSKTNVQKTIVYYPKNKSEQELIAGCFRNLDHLITLHQRKYEKLQIIKKSMLENCFPKNGEKVPKIRFAGFTGDWEQRKVGDYYEFKNGLNKGKEFFGEGTPIVNFTDVFHNRGISPEMLSGKVRLELSEIKNYEVKKGDIFFTRTSETIEEIGYPSVMLGEPENTVFSGFVLRGRYFLKDDPLDNLFKKYLFFTDVFRTEMLRKSSMTTRALTSGTAIKNMEFLHPSSKEEQHKIGELLTNLDHLITLHQSKLEKLQKVKKSLLERMFV